MRRYSLGTGGAIVAVLAVGCAALAFAQESDAKAISGTHEASCVVRITSDSAVLPMAEEFIQSLLTSTPVLGEPARELLGARSELYEEDFDISFESLTKPGPASERNLIGRIHVHLIGDVRPAADEFLAEVCRRLELALRQVGELDEERLRKRLAQVEEELERMDGQYKAIRATQRELLEQAGRNDLSRGAIEVTVRQLEDNKNGVELRLAGARAREAALAEQIAKIGQQVVGAAEGSAVLAELEKVVEIRERQLEYLKQRRESGLAPAAELDDAEEALARVRAELASVREHATETAGGGLLAGLNHKLVELSIDSAEAEATLAAVERRLAEIREKRLLELSDRYEREVELQLELSEQAVRQLTMEQYELKERIRDQQWPQVVVIGGR